MFPQLKNLWKASFITFSANGCHHSGSTKYLLIHWAHELCLKAQDAANKDYTKWSEAMCSSFANDYQKAAVTEVKTLDGNLLTTLKM